MAKPSATNPPMQKKIAVPSVLIAATVRRKNFTLQK
jgi:hypothetical protein